MPAHLPTAEDAAGKTPLTWGARWLLFFLRVAEIGLSAWIAVLLPLPILDEWLPVKNVVIAVLTIVLIGKSLFDTLFFDRYWP
jgi:hypothetical protein